MGAFYPDAGWASTRLTFVERSSSLGNRESPAGRDRTSLSEEDEPDADPFRSPAGAYHSRMYSSPQTAAEGVGALSRLHARRMAAPAGPQLLCPAAVAAPRRSRTFQSRHARLSCGLQGRPRSGIASRHPIGVSTLSRIFRAIQYRPVLREKSRYLYLTPVQRRTRKVVVTRGVRPDCAQWR
jgi:hypothetical protein